MGQGPVRDYNILIRNWLNLLPQIGLTDKTSSGRWIVTLQSHSSLRFLIVLFAAKVVSKANTSRLDTQETNCTWSQAHERNSLSVSRPDINDLNPIVQIPTETTDKHRT